MELIEFLICIIIHVLLDFWWIWIFPWHKYHSLNTSLNLFCSFLLALEYLSAVSFTSDTVSFYCFYILQHFQEFSFLFLSQLYSSVNTLPTETNLSWLKCETIKALKIKTSITFILGFVNNTLLWCLFLFSWRLTYIFSIYAIF